MSAILTESWGAGGGGGNNLTFCIKCQDFNFAKQPQGTAVVGRILGGRARTRTHDFHGVGNFPGRASETILGVLPLTAGE